MAPHQRYEEFEIEIRSLGKKGYEARVQVAPAPSTMRAADRFAPPFPRTELDRVLQSITARISFESIRQRSQRDITPEGASLEEPDPVDHRVLGEALYKALFQDNIRERFHESRGQLQARAAVEGPLGLRIRLSIDDEEDFAATAGPPWESMREAGRALALDLLTPIVRSVGRRNHIESLRTERLRVLLVASHAGALPLQLEAELQTVQSALKANPSIDVEVLPQANLSQLRETLKKGNFHVLHFMGHGSAPADPSKHFSLLFEREGDPPGEFLVEGDVLADHIKTAGDDLRLVVLNACWGAAFPRHEAQDPFTGVATELLRHGIPAIVAMQQPIADDAAIAFSDAFYRTLAEGEPIAAAVTEGRLALRQLSEIEWATPVLYLAANDDLFEIGPSEETSAETGAPALLRSDSPLLLEIRTFKNPFLAADRDPDDRLDLSGYFGGVEDRYIEDPAIWQSTLFPRLEEFLGHYKSTKRPLLFDFAAHATLAYAAGYLLENKSGLDITLLQRGRKVEPWSAGSTPAGPETLWRDDLSIPRRDGCPDVALSLSVTWDIEEDVARYLDLSAFPVGRQLAVGVPEPDRLSVTGEAHALQLAHSLVRKIRKRSYEEREAVLHLFASAPNALLFFLGQHQKGIGTVQLYEHDPKGKKPVRPGEPANLASPLRYEPSLRLPPASA